jgi:hypothetical protein
MLDTFRAEMVKLAKRPAIWILAAVFLVLAQVFGYLFPYIAYRAGGGSGFGAGQTAAQLLADILPARLVPNTLSGFPMFAGAIALVIGGLVAGSEYGWGTLKTILTQRSGRLAVIGGKLLAIVVTTAALVVIVFALNAMWSWVIASVESRPADWPAIGDLARGVGAGCLIIGTWGLFGAALGILFRSTSARDRPRPRMGAGDREPRAGLRRNARVPRCVPESATGCERGFARRLVRRRGAGSAGRDAGGDCGRDRHPGSSRARRVRDRARADRRCHAPTSGCRVTPGRGTNADFTYASTACMVLEAQHLQIRTSWTVRPETGCVRLAGRPVSRPGGGLLLPIGTRDQIIHGRDDVSGIERFSHNSRRAGSE